MRKNLPLTASLSTSLMLGSLAEHGGFSFGDTNVGLVVSNPHLHARVMKTPVATSQVAPTILRALGLDPDALDAVRKEETPALPDLGN
jgi:arylsulfatase A-like enzyme